MTFVRRRGLFRRIAGGKATEVLNPIIPVASALAMTLDPDTFTALHGTKIRRFHDRRDKRGRGRTKAYRKTRGWQAYPPSFLQDVLLLRPF